MPYWLPRADAVQAGYPSGAVSLEAHLATPELLADRCLKLQTDMLLWLDGQRHRVGLFDRTIGSVLSIYQTHPESPFRKLKRGGRKPYVTYLARMEREIADKRVDRVTGLEVQRWHRSWTQDGKYPAAGYVCLAVLKAALTFAIVVGYRECRPLRDDIGELRIPNPRPRRMVATAAQVVTIRQVAHALSRPSAALCYAVQFETTLRQWDVVGQWYDLDEPIASAVIDGRQKWAGLEWRHIGEDMILRYVPSKTASSSGAEIVVDLRLCPMVLEELVHVPEDRRRGPLVVFERTGQPYTEDQFRRTWKAVRAGAGLPPQLWNRDLRASAVTEGRGGGATTDDAAKVAGHTKSRITAEVYDREQLEAHRRFARSRLARRESGD